MTSRFEFRLVLATMAFGLALRFRGFIDPWLSTTVAALLVIVMNWSRSRRVVQDLLGSPKRSLLFAFGFGVFLAVATHLVFNAASSWLPFLVTDVSNLYAAIETSFSRYAPAPLIALVVFAEEVVWRDLVAEALPAELPGWVFFVVGVGLYAIPQLCSGSWILLAAALILGAVFLVQKRISGRTSIPLVTHAVWSLTVFCLFPLL